VDEDLLVLFVPGVERGPIETHHPGERVDLLAREQMSNARLGDLTDAKAVPPGPSLS